MRLRHGLLVTLVSLSGCGAGQHSPVLTPTGPLLPAWDYVRAASVVRKPPSSACLPDPIRGSLVAVQLVAWRVLERPGGARDEALWWAYFVTPDGPAWLLAMTFRDELDGSLPSWKFARVEPGLGPCGRPIYTRLAEAPSNQDLTDFFRDSGAAAVMRLPRQTDPGDWFHPAFLPGSRWMVRQAVVRDAAWQAAFGAAPPKAFQP